MTLEETINQMTEKNQLKTAVDFLQCTLPVWNEFSSSNNMSYTEHVIGTPQVISKSLIQDTIQAALSSNQKAMEIIAHEIQEPISAIQDGDWEIDETLKLIIYSAYNLLQHLLEGLYHISNESSIYLSINQSIDVLMQKNILTTERIKLKLKNAL